MAVFDRTSRYAELVPTEGRDAEGRSVPLVPFRPPQRPRPVARHERGQGQRLDHVAAGLLGDPHGYWRICECMDALSADALAERDVLDLPERAR